MDRCAAPATPIVPTRRIGNVRLCKTTRVRSLDLRLGMLVLRAVLGHFLSLLTETSMTAVFSLRALIVLVMANGPLFVYWGTGALRAYLPEADDRAGERRRLPALGARLRIEPAACRKGVRLGSGEHAYARPAPQHAAIAGERGSRIPLSLEGHVSGFRRFPNAPLSMVREVSAGRNTSRSLL